MNMPQGPFESSAPHTCKMQNYCRIQSLPRSRLAGRSIIRRAVREKKKLCLDDEKSKEKIFNNFCMLENPTLGLHTDISPAPM